MQAKSIRRHLPGAYTLALALASPAAALAGTVPCQVSGHTRECIKVPLASAEQDRQAKGWQAPPAGMAYLYVVRPHTQQPMTAVTVAVDGSVATVLGPLTYARLAVRPGRHEVTVGAVQQASYVVALDAGKIYALEYEMVLRFGATVPELRPLEMVQASTKMRGSRLVAGNTD